MYSSFFSIQKLTGFSSDCPSSVLAEDCSGVFGSSAIDLDPGIDVAARAKPIHSKTTFFM